MASTLPLDHRERRHVIHLRIHSFIYIYIYITFTPMYVNKPEV
jgi:hypothetical protein